LILEETVDFKLTITKIKIQKMEMNKRKTWNSIKPTYIDESLKEKSLPVIGTESATNPIVK
jgi:hypothetical protein